jgi:transcriptional regulator with XRE-family HTH domain
MNGKEFKAIREKLGLSTTQLGEIVGFCERHIRRLEADGAKIRKPLIFQMNYLLAQVDPSIIVIK